MSDSRTSINPYAPSTVVEASAGPESPSLKRAQEASPSLRRVAIRWFVVCALSAIPSFFFGLALTDGRASGMIAGVLIFTVLYIWLDMRTADWTLRRKPTVQRTLRIAYGTRILISVLFPVGMYVDLYCGVLSVGLMQLVLGRDFSFSDPMNFGAALMTTLVQGCVLNVVLASYGLLVQLLQIGVIAMKRSRRKPA